MEKKKKDGKHVRSNKWANTSKAGGNQPRSELCTEPGAWPTHSFRRRDKSNQKDERGTPRGDGTKEQQGTINSKGRSKIDPQLGSKPRRCATPTHPKRIKGSAGATNFSDEEEEVPKALLEKGLSGPHKPKSNEVGLNEDDLMPIGN